MAKAGQSFRWGAASAAFQVEGAWQADGKGLSNWDVYTNKHRITEVTTGRVQTGNTAINAYDRTQYLADIALMRELGLDVYRFSISWPRIFPDGTGRVNEAGIAHYRRFMEDLRENGIEPFVTLFHWDMPQTLHQKGGWFNPDSPKWFLDYAHTIFDRLGDLADNYISLNEPFISIFLIEPAVENILAGKPPFPITSAQYGRYAVVLHHWCLASALATGDLRRDRLGKHIGMALPLLPTIPVDATNRQDVAAAELADAIFNRWCLDAMFRGTYPAEALAALQTENPAFRPTEAEMETIRANPADLLGINFYSPIYVRHDPTKALGISWMENNPDEVKAFNGPVRPEALYGLLMRMKTEYGNPLTYITENGAGFGERDERHEGGVVKDPLRADYILRHAEAVLRARADGANVQGYMVWSLFDNFEWLQGYDRRFGIVFVDFETQQRVRKQSFNAYRDFIAAHR